MFSASTSLSDAQRDMRSAYLGGAAGLFASALVWAAAGIVAMNDAAAQHAFLTLFFGGMLIHPMAVLLSKSLGRSGAYSPGNPLGPLALEGTAILLLGFPLAYAAAQSHAEWFFPTVLMVIGGRYLTFSTLYGLRAYWICGASLVILGIGSGRLLAAIPVAAFACAVIETVFAVVVYVAVRREQSI